MSAAKHPHEGSLELATLVARRVSVSRGSATILSEIDLVLTPAERIGVVGPNGVGKTTLLRVLAGLETPEAGHVTVTPPRATVGYLAQEPEHAGGETLAELLRRRTGVAAAERELTDAAEVLGASAHVEPGAEPSERYAAALERYLALGGPDFDARAAVVLGEMGVPERLSGVRIEGLSGGQYAKAALCALLLSQFDLLLLDEPTNNLDFEGLERLEGFLEARRGGVVVVSHDRALLARIVTSVLEIDEASHRGSLHAGGFDAYLEQRATARRHAEERYGAYVAERTRLRARERDQRQWATSGVAREKRKPRDNDKAQRDFRINRTEKQAAKVRHTERALERLEVAEKPYEPWQLDLTLKSAGRSGELVGLLEGAVVRRGDWSLGPIDLDVAFADRVAVLGSNGSGKTTLLQALLGRVPLAEGSRRLGPGVVVGELGQERHGLADPGRQGGASSLLGAFLRTTGATTSQTRSLLAKFGLGPGDVERPVVSLSPGERTRAELALLMAKGTNCLVLDEPTNHLDLPAIEQLEEALESWEGTLLLVTHDRRLLESLRLTSRVDLSGAASLRPSSSLRP